MSANDHASTIDGSVYCIEAIPVTADKLTASAQTLGWDQSFLVTKAVISNTLGDVYFRSEDSVGIEHLGIDNCEKLKSNPEEFNRICRKVDVYTLDNFMHNIAKKSDAVIDILSIDVEGYDFYVILGGKATIGKAKYLEFEYNWMGSWQDQKLMDAIDLLDNLHFTCYRAGDERLWRIDQSCWMEHYSWHVLSNIACANRILFPEVAKRMESTFQTTLKDKSLKY